MRVLEPFFNQNYDESYTRLKVGRGKTRCCLLILLLLLLMYSTYESILPMHLVNTSYPHILLTPSSTHFYHHSYHPFLSPIPTTLRIAPKRSSLHKTIYKKLFNWLAKNHFLKIKKSLWIWPIWLLKISCTKMPFPNMITCVLWLNPLVCWNVSLLCMRKHKRRLRILHQVSEQVMDQWQHNTTLIDKPQTCNTPSQCSCLSNIHPLHIPSQPSQLFLTLHDFFYLILSFIIHSYIHHHHLYRETYHLELHQDHLSSHPRKGTK